MDHDDHHSDRQSERRRGDFVMNLVDDLDLQEVVSGPERPQLPPTALQRLFADRLRIGPA